MAKRPREDPALKQLSARLAATPSTELASLLSAALGSPAAVLALLPAPRTAGHIDALNKLANAIGKAATCRFSKHNAFSLNRARGAIAAFKRGFREQVR
jgi:hypothetical protein